MTYKDNSNSFIIRRGLAYLLDVLFITILTMLIAQIRVINPMYEKYTEEYSKYEEIIKNTEDIKSILKDDKANDIMYNMSRYSVVYTLIDAGVLLAYFVLFQKTTNGQTLGKRIFKVQVVGKDGDKVKWWQLLVRSLFLYEIVSSIVLSIAIMVLSKDAYLSTNSIVSTIFQITTYVCIFMLIIRKDGRGLHDLVAGTKVIDLKEAIVKEQTGESDETVKEAEYVEVSKTAVQGEKKKTINKSKNKSK